METATARAISPPGIKLGIGGFFYSSFTCWKFPGLSYNQFMFYLRNFKNFAAAELDLDQPATLLVGPNGSGKSNLIEAVELLSFLAAGHRLHEITDIGREGAIEVRGGLEACAKLGFDEFTLGIKTDVTYQGIVIPTQVQYEITVPLPKESLMTPSGQL